MNGWAAAIHLQRQWSAAVHHQWSAAVHHQWSAAVHHQWGAVLWFLASVALLVLIGHWINRLVQGVGWLLFGDERAVYLLTYIIFLPGIVIHELSHWVMAWLLGMRPRQLSIWPKVRGKKVELGSVRVSSGGALRDSLTGMAPLLVGSLIVLLVTVYIFDGDGLQRAWGNGVGTVWSAFWAAFRVPNAWLWAYLVFSVSNAMLPSSSDRQPLLSLLLYVAIVGLVFYLTGWLPQLTLPSSLTEGVVGALRMLTTAFAFTIALDLVVVLPLLGVQFLVVALSRAR